MNKYLSLLNILLCYGLIFGGCAPKPVEVGKTAIVDLTTPPDWYPYPQPDDDFYQGVGSSPFIGNIQNTMEAATQNAIFDLVRSIETSIKGSLIDSVWEGMGISGEFIKQVVETSVNQRNLPEIEVVSKWVKPGINDVFVFVRLNKKFFTDYQEQRKETALKYTIRYLSDGDYQFQKNKFSTALQYYLTSFYYSRYLLGEFNEVEYPEYSGRKININMALSNKIQSFLDDISVKVINVPNYIKTYHRSKTPLEVMAEVKVIGYGKGPLNRFPIMFMAEDSSVNLNRIVHSDNNGMAKTYLKTKNSQKETASIYIKLALDSVYIEKENLRVDLPVLYDKVFISPFERVEIPIIPTYVYLSGRETINGVPVLESEKFVTRALQKRLSSEGGIAFVSDRKEADFVIELNANCKFQTEEDDFYVFMAYMSVDVIKGNSRDKIFSNIFEPVEGFGNYMRQGGIRTLEKAGIIMFDRYAPLIVEIITGEG